MVLHAEAFGNVVRQLPVFNDKNDSAMKCRCILLSKMPEVLVDLAADGALRAMLENEDRIGFRHLEKYFKISILAQLNYHDFRVTDSATVAEE